MSERRYRDDEVRRIFELAAARGANAPAPTTSATGLTLTDMQSVAREVGLDPAAVARAAASVDGGAMPPQRKWLGLPVQVAHVAPLPHALSDAEWGMLVSELRTTFSAKGKVAESGALREWSNGNLSVCVEPTSNGYRLRMSTFRSDAAAASLVGVAALVSSAFTTAALTNAGSLTTKAVLVPLMMAVAGVAALVSNYIRIPRWARRRKEQMQHLAAWIQSITTDTGEAT